MWRSNLLVALRLLWRNRLITAINVAGLSAALTVAVLALLFVRRETSFDDWHENGDRIHAVYGEATAVQSTGFHRSMMVGEEVSDAIRTGYAGIRRSTRVRQGSGRVRVGEAEFDEYMIATDPEFLDMFTFPLSAGDPQTALRDPAGVVLTAETAQKYFGAGDALGRRILLHFVSKDYSTSPPAETILEEERLVTGVLAELPGPSVLRFRMLVPYAASETLVFRGLWGLYIELDEHGEAAQIEAQLAVLAADHFDGKQDLRLLSLEGAHFAEPVVGVGSLGSGTVEHCYLLLGVAALILTVACINFVNLSVGRALARTLEIGVRKSIGAARSQLASQFLIEATVVTLVAVVIGLALVEVMLPSFNEVTAQHLELVLLSVETVAAAAALTLCVGIAAGMYPALVSSRLHPVRALEGTARISGRGRIGRSLIVVQFALSSLLVIVVVTMERQLDFMTTKDLGFDGHQVLLVGVEGGLNELTLERVGQQVASRSSLVEAIAGATPAPGLGDMGPLDLEMAGAVVTAKTFLISPGLVGTMGLRVVAGRDFDPAIESDMAGGILINESAARRFGGRSPVGETVTPVGPMAAEPVHVIGVVEDFHYATMREPVGPAVLRLKPKGWMGDSYWHVLARLDESDLPAAVADLERLWSALLPEHPMQPRLLGDVFARRYEVERRVGRVMRWMSVIALVISCMGLFGLAALTAARRTKEVGIRKALGATVSSVLMLMSREFAWTAVAGNVIAWPIAYVALDRWLTMYAYRIDIGVLSFGLAGLLVLGIAMMTVSGQILRVARTNPVEALRYE